MDDLYTARASIWKPAPVCWGFARRKLAGVDDLCTAVSANQQPAPACCWGLAHRKFAGVDNPARPLHCMGRYPAAGSGRLRGVGAQEARWCG